jgi:hypothetical protein
MLVDAPLLLIPAESLSQFLQSHEIPPAPSSIDQNLQLRLCQILGGCSIDCGHDVRYIPIYCFGLCQHRRRLPHCNNLKMAVRTIPRHGLSHQLKTRMIKLTLNSMRPQLASHMYALFVIADSAVCRSETDTSNRTFRIRFFAHSRVVPGRVVVNGTFKSTGEESI